MLRFNDVTRQTVMRVRVSASGSSGRDGGSSGRQASPGMTVEALPGCLAQEYLKTMASLVAALLGLQRLQGQASARGGASADGSALASEPDHQQQPRWLRRRLRVLCIGVGGGSLPLFLSHTLPWVEVDAVELDPAVVAAAMAAMGLPADHPRLRLHTADAAAFLRAWRRRRQQQDQQQQHPQPKEQQQPGAGWQQPSAEPWDLIIQDTFDGQDAIPAALCTQGAVLQRQPRCGFLLALLFCILAVCRPPAAVGTATGLLA